VTEFGANAFSFCYSLQSINIPPSLVHIGNSCFAEDELMSRVLFDSPSRLTSIGGGVFRNCRRLSSFSIPPRLQILDGASFLSSSIIHVEVDPENQMLRMINSCLVNVLTHSIVHYFSEDSSVVISTSIQELGSFAFGANFSLTAVTFESPSIVVKFFKCAFYHCLFLESICIPSSVRFIGERCFHLCDRLVSVTFEQPSTLEIINNAAFNACKSLTHVSIPVSIQQIGRHCFFDCESLTSITFESPSNLTILCDLGNLMLTSLDIPDSVEVIRGMTQSSTAGSLIVSFGSKSKLSAVYPTYSVHLRIGAFVRYSEATLRKFRANVDDFADGAAAQV
jgi:hypothetical protein